MFSLEITNLSFSTNIEGRFHRINGEGKLIHNRYFDFRNSNATTIEKITTARVAWDVSSPKEHEKLLANCLGNQKAQFERWRQERFSEDTGCFAMLSYFQETDQENACIFLSCVIDEEIQQNLRNQWVHLIELSAVHPNLKAFISSDFSLVVDELDSSKFGIPNNMEFLSGTPTYADHVDLSLHSPNCGQSSANL